MSDFALVTFKASSSKGLDEKITLLERIAGRIAKLLKKHSKPVNDAVKVEICDGMNMYIFMLPWSIDELDGLGVNRIQRFIAALCGQYNVSECILPGNFTKKELFSSCPCNVYTGNFLFKSLLMYVLNELYSVRGIKIGSLDIVLIHGDNDRELFSVLKQIAPEAKYLTILTDRKETVENEINSIYSDSGLSVGISSDPGSCLKGAGLVVNLGGADSFYNRKLRVNSRALVVNMDKAETNKYFSNELLVNGVEIGLPESILSRTDISLISSFGSSEIAEIILAHRLNLVSMAIERKIDDIAAKSIMKEFKSEGFRITGLVGRYNVIKIRDVQLYGVRQGSESE